MKTAGGGVVGGGIARAKVGVLGEGLPLALRLERRRDAWRLGGWIAIAVVAAAVAALFRSALAKGSTHEPTGRIYMISVAAELVGVHPQTLRIYENKGLVRPQRTPGGTRLYSEADVERLRIVQRLTTELGLNLAGVELVLRLEDELRKAHAQIERLQRSSATRSDGCTRNIAATSWSIARSGIPERR